VPLREKRKIPTQGFFEVPFSSDRKKMSVILKNDKGYRVYTKGAPEIILNNCSNLLSSGNVMAINENEKHAILDANLKMSQNALRNLACAYKDITEEEFVNTKNSKGDFENNLTFVGIQGMIDPPRAEVKSLVESCNLSGIRVVMITGDHIETAKAIAKQIGITGEALHGEDLDKVTAEDFEKQVENISIYARVSPASKMKIVEALKKKGHIVAMTGDGVNDAPALKNADIGIAMGIKGTDVAKEASDLILLDDNFSTIVEAVKEGRGIFQNIRKFVNYLLSCNLGEVLLVLLTVIIFKDIPLTATMLLWINVVTDGLPAVALGVDPAEKNIMSYTPQKFQEQIIDKVAWIQMLFFGFLLSIGCLFIYFQNLSEGVREAQGAAFLTIVILELVNVLIIRQDFKMSFFSNKWVLISVIGSLVLQLTLMYVPFLAKVFEIKPIDTHDWLIIIISIVSITILALLFNQFSRYLFSEKRSAVAK
jgi:Ca2+-transporting ATPase